MSYHFDIKANSMKLDLLYSHLNVAYSLRREDKCCTDIINKVLIFRLYKFAEQESSFNNTEGLNILFKLQRNTNGLYGRNSACTQLYL